MAQSITTTIGLAANSSSGGQPVDFDGASVANLVVSNNSGASIQYSLDGSTWTSIANGSSAQPVVSNPALFRLRKSTSDSYPVPVDLRWMAGQSALSTLAILKRKAVAAQQFNPLDASSLSGITVTNTTNAADVQLAVSFDAKATYGTGVYRAGGGVLVGSSGAPMKAATIATTSNVGVTGAYQTGPWVEFMVPATATSARVNFYTGGTPNISYYRVAVDGRYLNRAMTGFSGNTGIFNQLTIDLSTYETGATRRIRVEYDNFAMLTSFGVNAGTIWQPYDTEQLNVCLIGDSFFAYGSGGSGRSPHTSVGAQAMQRMGAAYTMSGVGGTGYIANGGGNYAFSSANRIADLSLQSFDLVVISGGTNDVGNSASALTAAAMSTLSAYRTALPNTPIIVTGVWNGQASQGIITMAQAETAIRAGFNALNDANMYFVPVCGAASGAWITSGNSSAFVADGTHFTAAGEWYAGQRLAAGISDAIGQVS